MSENTDANAESRGVDPGQVRLERDARGRLVFRAAEGASAVENVSVARCFPWSFREGYVSIRDADGRELCLVRSLDALAAETRRRIEEELGAQEFVPRITAVLEMDDRFDVMVWKVRTDRGPVDLQVEHAEDIRQLADGRVLIKDHSGGVYEVPDLRALDPRSRALLEDHLS